MHSCQLAHFEHYIMFSHIIPIVKSNQSATNTASKRYAIIAKGGRHWAGQ